MVELGWGAIKQNPSINTTQERMRSVGVVDEEVLVMVHLNISFVPRPFL
ncbi:hypothetical protein RB2083_999 [Rhodobacteraceae bacterium HTCC2083]|nr:hypothetical protein RB2083_999 [Rhodobacteraceae bacterium HTCC2083]